MLKSQITGSERTGRPYCREDRKLLAWLESLKAELGIPKSIREAGVQEADFLAHVDKLSEDAFDDQCTGANPRYPLISELKQILLDTYYGRNFTESDVAAVKVEIPAVVKADKSEEKRLVDSVIKPASGGFYI